MALNLREAASGTLAWYAVTAALCVGLATYALPPGVSTTLTARVLVPDIKTKIPWRVFDPEEVESGATLMPNTNIIIHLPTAMGTLTRETLFGHQGKLVRYWGYCFPDNYDPATAKKIVGLPGKVFLSEADRAWRDAERERRAGPLSIYRPPTKEQLYMREHPDLKTIRHQLEVFEGGKTCFLMTEKPIPMGTDADRDGLNAKEESQAGTNPRLADSDADGLMDGIEVMNLRTNPLRRDSDADGLIDGVEEKNHNGKVDLGETSPFEIDSDHDGLCDGLCRTTQGGRLCSDFAHTTDCDPKNTSFWLGEDRNLNGQRDKNETNALNVDSCKDGISDYQHVFACALKNGGKITDANFNVCTCQ